MRDIKPQVNFKNLEIDGVDTTRADQRHRVAKRPNKRLTASIVLITIIIILAGGFGIYTLVLKASPTGEIGTQALNTSPSSDMLTAKTLVAKASATTKGDIKQKMQTTDGTDYAVYSAPSFKPNGFNFSVYPTTEYGFGTYGTRTIVANDIVYIQKVMIDNNLNEKIINIGSDAEQFAAKYESSTIICLLTDQKPYNEPTDSDKYSASIGCANKSDYLDTAAGLRQYFIVYSTQSTVENSANIVMTGPTIKKSKSPGYSTATVGIGGSEFGSIGGFAGLFYATPDGTLHYFTGTQSELACSSYNTEDLKRAYLGESCYDQFNATSAKVTL